MHRTILHLDLDAFFCAVEEQKQPELKGTAFAVGGLPEHRGVVASCSYAARKYGVRSAMPMSTALQRCPHLRIVDRSMGDYSAVSRQVMNLLHDLTPLVEQLSIDEAFLDVTGLPDDGEISARRLQARINTELDLPCSLGVASNKLVAKIANNIGKASAAGDGPPNAIKVVPPGTEAAFLAPLSIRELWGVGPKTAERLHKMDVQTIGDLTRWSERDLMLRFGKLGYDLARRARGLDDRPVETERETKSVSAETTFIRDIDDVTELKRTLRQLAEQVGHRARRSHLTGKTVAIKLRWSDFTTLTRQMTLPQPVDQDEIIYNAAVKLFEQVWSRGRPVRLLGVGLSGFDAEPAAQQLGLWDAAPPEEARPNDPLQAALDDLRDRFGDDAIRRGSDLRD
jgi:DNA polymerase IV